MIQFFLNLKSVANEPNYDAGIALSFDDVINDRVITWLDYHNNHGAAKGWKMSMAAIYTNNASYLSAMQTLSNYGHEICNHTYSHFYDIDEYMLTHTGEDYYNDHCKPCDDWLIGLGYDKPTNFVWPYGYENDEVADYLLSNDIYKILRGTNLSGPTTPIRSNDCIWDGGNRPIGLTMDSHWDWWTEQDFYDLLEYANNNNKIVEFFGHNIQNPEGGAKNVPIDMMNNICDYVNDNGMKFYTYKELADLL